MTNTPIHDKDNTVKVLFFVFNVYILLICVKWSNMSYFMGGEGFETVRIQYERVFD